VIRSAVVPEAAQGKRQSEVGGAIVEFMLSQPAGVKKAEVVKHFKDRHDSSSVYRVIKTLVSEGRLHECVGIISLAKKVPNSAD